MITRLLNSYNQNDLFLYRISFLFLFALLWLCCQSDNSAEKHVFYLHGRIIELQGVNAVSPQFGKYEYNTIIDSLKSTAAVVHNDIRTAETDFNIYCQQVSHQINQLIKEGISPGNITVIGASKGAVMAMNISSQTVHPINYILLAGNNDQIESENNWNLHGRIFGIYEKTDQLAGKNYQYWIDRSTNALDFQQLEINTGLGHGFLYRPLREWWDPAKAWMED